VVTQRHGLPLTLNKKEDQELHLITIDTPPDSQRLWGFAVQKSPNQYSFYPEWIDVEETAKILRMKLTTVLNHYGSGCLPGVELNERIWIHQDDLNEFIHERASEAHGFRYLEREATLDAN
jgi:hypothetical protein